MTEVLLDICNAKRQRIAKKGFTLGHVIPYSRTHPIIKPTFPLFIAEVKRKSPSLGSLKDIKHPALLATAYKDCGANAISVLCEEDYFGGSLNDLMEVKKALPEICVLRKDFILEPEEVEVSYLAGADMVLLIVNLFLDDFKKLELLFNTCLKFNLTPLVEVHDEKELEMALKLDIDYGILGINSRNLDTLKINKLNAFILRQKVPSEIPVIFESGIDNSYDAFIVGSVRFEGFLVGSYLMQALNMPNMKQTLFSRLINLIASFKAGAQRDFFYKLVNMFVTKKPPLIKVCGINNIDFALSASKHAHLLGFVLVKSSPRFVDAKFLEKINEYENIKNALKIGVVADKESLKLGLELIKKNLLDCLQLHEAEDLDNGLYFGLDLKEATFCYYKAVKNVDSKDSLLNLLDSSHGEGIEADLDSISGFDNLAIAGGVSEANLESFLNLSPKLIDLCSALESSKGIKDTTKLESFFNKLNTCNCKK
ncbi:bifunctional indole-3-glycerol phosphate synthase/phosphoribosylanthranilate isomerase [Helicobacter sp. 11S02629-2]|uniref:bifunctional indole-3-glycerol phosphate synthase/phosphoribosylanthranilate isomerase n=1 Tax=Helicobacter sp. 11S02629-2 TaxID=1476195 RepID=UPI000BA6640D|nr:bifunctional indole-3-glycerol phosphate synthase/phosphoribosylanthranilate isomerase [Helicobacter sp. 11S02629-2]PAF43667.1 hypothetical protein BKH40_06600 [Helicobacter sp. 11S02629-2]